MNCPKCHCKTNINDTANKYFLGRNSIGTPFFKCEECGDLFYVKDGSAHTISRGEKGLRFVPITFGIFEMLIAIAIFYFFGGNIFTWIIGGIIILTAWSNVKIGFRGSQQLVDEMTLHGSADLSKEADEELRKISKL